MANLKELRNKVSVVTSIRKVTAAMKLVAGVKLRKAEQKAMASREYASELGHMLAKIRRESLTVNCELFSGRDSVATEMLVVFASDKGLCGNFNYVITKEVFRIISDLHQGKKKIHLVCVGAKPFEILKQRLNANDVIEPVEDFYGSEKLFDNSRQLAQKIIDSFNAKDVDKVSVIFTRSHSAMHREVQIKNIIPLTCEVNPDKTDTIFEPNVEDVLKSIVPYNVAIQIYQSALESMTSEQGSRMTSMDSATRNADDLLSDLTIKYNRTRQYNITQELTEVVSGASAVAKG